MLKPEVVRALRGHLVSDAFGAPFEFHEDAENLARCSVREQRYLTGRDTGAKADRVRVPGLYTDDSQQAMLLLWCYLRSPDRCADLFRQMCRLMAVQEPSARFGLHRGTGKNFRRAIGHNDLNGFPGLGAAMRVGPAALQCISPEEVLHLVETVCAVTTLSLEAFVAALFYAHTLRGDKVTPPLNREGLVIWDTLWGALSLNSAEEIIPFIDARVPFPDVRRTPLNPADGTALSGVVWAIRSSYESTLEAALLSAASLGGDTDTVCALTGALHVRRHNEVPPWMEDQLVCPGFTLNPFTWDPFLSERSALVLEQDLRRNWK